jgi:hypothetical protein
MWDQLTQEQRWGFMYAAQLKNAFHATFNNEQTHPTNITGEDMALAALREVGNVRYQEVLARKTELFAVAFQQAAPEDQVAIQQMLNVPDVIQEG